MADARGLVESGGTYTPEVRLLAIRAQKLLAALRRPAYRRAFVRHRVLPTVELAPLLGGNFRTVIDVGANRGQFALVARATWPEARIISFEPVPSAAATFSAVFEGDSGVELHRFALGSAMEERVLTVPAADDGASFLVQLRGVPLTVQVRRLDAVDLDFARPALLKLDVQGFELEVLKGASLTLPFIDAVVAECSFAAAPPIPPASELIDFMSQADFRLTGAVAGGEYGDLRFERRH